MDGSGQLSLTREKERESFLKTIAFWESAFPEEDAGLWPSPWKGLGLGLYSIQRAAYEEGCELTAATLVRKFFKSRGSEDFSHHFAERKWPEKGGGMPQS